MVRILLLFLNLLWLRVAVGQVLPFEPELFQDNRYFGLTISPDGKEMFFVKTFGGRDSLQIHYSEQINGKWTTPKLAVFADVKAKQIDPIFSPDGRTTSNDIYVSYFRDGHYEKAIPLGPAINTIGNESNPFISPDESFIIFFADRKNGFGETDLYISFKKGNKWSKPINLGKDINSGEGEFCPSIDFSNKRFLFSRTIVINGKRSDTMYTYPLKKLGLRLLRKQAEWLND